MKREFIKLVTETLVLLGAEKRLVENIKASEDNPFSPEVIDDLKKYNGEQKDKTKHSTALLNTTFSYL